MSNIGSDNRNGYSDENHPEEKYLALFNELSDAVFVADAETGILLDVNKKAEALIGLSRDKLIGMHFSKLHPPDMESLAREKFKHRITTGSIDYSDFVVQNSAGEAVPVYVKVSMIRYGNRPALVGIFRDRTEIKKEDQTNTIILELMNILNKGQDSNRSIIEIFKVIKGYFGFEFIGIRFKDDKNYPFLEMRALADGFDAGCFVKCSCDSNYYENGVKKTNVMRSLCADILCGRINYDSPTTTKNGSYWTNDFEGMRSKYLAYDPKDSVGEQCATVDFQSIALIPIRSGNEIIGVFQLGDPKKDKLSLETVQFMEKIATSIGIAIDRLKTETMIRNAADEWMVTLDSIPEMVIRIDANNKILRVNKAVTHDLGINYNEAIGKDFTAVLSAIDPAFKDCIEIAKSKSGNSRNLECFAHNIGRYYLCSSSRILDNSGRERGEVYVFEDITERNRLEEELQNSRKLETVGMLAGGIAHDFNNLLTTIWGNVSLTMKETGISDEVGEMLSDAEQACRRAAALTRQLLTFASGGDPVKKTVSMYEILTDAIGGVFKGSKSKCETQIADDLMLVEADIGQMTQVFSNILTNADQAMPIAGTVTVTASNVDSKEMATIAPHDFKGHGAVKIVIKDRGIGMSPEYISRIFDPFFTTKQKGRGLGLSVAYRIIEKHGGFIRVNSKLGQGSEFSIYLPASEKTQQLSRDTKIIKRRVLVMDDEELVRKVIGTMLKNLGCEVDFATHGDEAMRMYINRMNSETPYDAVFLNLTIPNGMGGKDTVKNLRNINPSVKAVALSGFLTDPAMHNPGEFGFDGKVPKPMEFGTLEKVIQSLFNEN